MIKKKTLLIAALIVKALTGCGGTSDTSSRNCYATNPEENAREILALAFLPQSAFHPKLLEWRTSR
jgi:outer membrane lipoprotein SlyB